MLINLIGILAIGMIAYLSTIGVSVFVSSAILFGTVLAVGLTQTNKSKKDWKRIIVSFGLLGFSIWLKVNVFYDLV